MPSTTLIKKGESLPFSFDRGGEDISGWVCVIEVKRYPTDTAVISRTITPDDDQWCGFLTQNETELLNVGHYRLIANLTNATTNEKEEIPLRFHVTQDWS